MSLATTVGRAIAYFSLFFINAAWSAELSSVATAAYEQGKHYQLVNPPQPTATGDKIEILEAFSYACPHCNDFDPIVSSWVVNLPADVAFRRLPVTFNKDSWVALAKAYFVAEALGNLDAIGPRLFKALHVDKRKLYDESALADFFGEQGIDKEVFRKTFESFSVDSKMRLAGQKAAQLATNGVPTLYVNGKYQVSASMGGGDYKSMLKIAEFLIAKERGSNAKATK